MKNEGRKSKKTDLLKSWAALAGVLAAAAGLLLIFPDRQQAAAATAWGYLREMIAILPAVMVIMGLFAVFVSKEQVGRYLGKASGIKGFLLAILLGSLPTGPLYVAFPLAAALLKKGARVSSIVIFLSAWACIKIPQELVELQFLGLEFMALRLVLTIVFVVLMGFSVEKLMGTGGGNKTGATVGGENHEGV
jgi:uncharacterized membrane protein YraQ (UPF0718 family)